MRKEGTSQGEGRVRRRAKGRYVAERRKGTSQSEGKVRRRAKERYVAERRKVYETSGMPVEYQTARSHRQTHERTPVPSVTKVLLGCWAGQARLFVRVSIKERRQ